MWKTSSRQSTDTSEKSDLLSIISERLAICYVETQLGNKKNAMDELLYILLSLQTNEQLYRRSYAAFKIEFPRWSLVADASIAQIKYAIRESGLAGQKARHISAIARQLKQEFGSVTLAPLKKLTEKQAEDYLLTLPGVGIKTARCVLMYSLGHDVFPVDIHCARIMDRLGLIQWQGKRLETIANGAQDVVPKSLRKKLHVRFIQHGREICRAKPDCEACILSDLCPTSSIRNSIG